MFPPVALRRLRDVCLNAVTFNGTLWTWRGFSIFWNIVMSKSSKSATKSSKYGYVDAIIMLFCYSIVLGTIYVEHRPYSYTSSYTALMASLYKNNITNVEKSADIWDWLHLVVSSIGGKAINSVNANCAYDDFNTQLVTIDGKEYLLEYPYLQMNSCNEDNLDFVQGSSDEVYLAGNHQLLVFGIFTQRGTPRFPIKNSVKNYKSSRIHVSKSSSERLNPLADEKIVEICQVNWTMTSNSPTSYCLLRDAYKNRAGTTLDWDGKMVEGKYAYDEGSRAFVVSPLSTEPIELIPCYTYKDTLEPTNQPTLSPTVPTVRSNGFVFF